MPRKPGEPKGSGRCHPRKVTIKVPAGPEGHAGDRSAAKVVEWRSTMARSVDRTAAHIRELAGNEREIELAILYSSHDDVEGMLKSRVAGLLASGARPEILIAALRNLGEQIATAEPDADGEFAFTASTRRGRNGEPSSTDLAVALGLACIDAQERTWEPFSVGPDAFLAHAPTAKSYAKALRSIPETRELIERVPRAAYKAFDEQENLIGQYERGEITLAQLVEADRANMDAAEKEMESLAKEAAVALSSIPPGTAQSSALARALDQALDDGRAHSYGLYASVEEAEKALAPRDARGRARKDDSAEEGDEGYGDEDYGDEDYGDEDYDYDRSVRSRRYDIESHIRWRDNSIEPVSLSDCNPSALMSHVDLYAAQLHQTETDGNRSSARQMASLLASGIISSDEEMRRINGRYAFRGWDGVTQELGYDAARQGDRMENVHYSLDFLEDKLPFIHDFSGPYTGATLPPAAYILAEHLDSETAARLAGAATFPDGWQQRAAGRLVERYGMSKEAAERQVARAEAHLFPTEVPPGGDHLVYRQRRARFDPSGSMLAGLDLVKDTDLPYAEVLGKDGRRWRIDGVVEKNEDGRLRQRTYVRSLEDGEVIAEMPRWNIVGGIRAAASASGGMPAAPFYTDRPATD